MLTTRKRESKMVRSCGTVTTCSSEHLTRSFSLSPSIFAVTLSASKRERGRETWSSARERSNNRSTDRRLTLFPHRRFAHPLVHILRRAHEEEIPGLLTLARRLRLAENFPSRRTLISPRATFVSLAKITGYISLSLSNYSIARIR